MSSEASTVSNATLFISGMSCASCVAHVSRAARSLPGVNACQVNLARGRAAIEFDPALTSADDIAGHIREAGYDALVESPRHGELTRLDHQAKHARGWLIRALIGFCLWLPVESGHWILQLCFPQAHHAHLTLVWISFFTSSLCLLLVGGSFFKSAWNAFRHRTTNMDTLIALGATVAYGYSLFCLLFTRVRGDLYFMESSALLALISLGHWLEANARRSAGNAIADLMSLAPATALRIKDDGTAPSISNDASEEVPVLQLRRNDKVVVRPGDRIPVDGIITLGTSSVDESLVTGEAMPINRNVGDAVIGGTLNVEGRLIVRATKLGADSALAQIVQLVEKAQDSRAPVQKLADRIAAVFVPVVLLIAIVTAVGWFSWGNLHHWPAGEIWAQLAKAVCSVLLIACPCALGLAVPAAIMVGTGLGARRGILIRDIDALQMAEKIDTIALDKTGTLTQGKPIVTGMVGDDDVLLLAAAAEQFSSHPIAKAIVNEARKRGLRVPMPTKFQNEPGFGITAEINGRSILIGNRAMLGRYDSAQAPVPQSLQMPDPSQKNTDSTTLFSTLETGVGTTVFIAEKISNTLRIAGRIEVTDAIKPDSAAAVCRLRDMGFSIALLTGDNPRAAGEIARQVGISDVRAALRPGDKSIAIAQLQDNGLNRVAMVGDGINDAPALASADLGIALGGGSDVAKETGGIVLVGPSLHGVVTAIELSRATMRIIRQNLFFALFYNVLAIPLAALGLLHPVVAAAAMALSNLTVVGNALRLRWSPLDRPV